MENEGGSVCSYYFVTSGLCSNPIECITFASDDIQHAGQRDQISRIMAESWNAKIR